MADWTDFVGREEYLARLLSGEVGTGAFYDVRGVAGAGKSVLLYELERRIGDEHITVLIDTKDYVNTFDQIALGGRHADPRGEVDRFCRILSAILGSLWDRPPEVANAIKAMLDDIGRLRIGAGTALGGQTARSSTPDAELADQVGELVRRLQERINTLIGWRGGAGQRVFFLIDTFDVVQEPLRGWFLDLLGGLGKAVVVVAHDTTAPSTASLPGATATLQISGLTENQINDYLVGRLGPQDAEVVTAVFEFTGGHALTVGLTADLIMQRRRHGEAVDTANLLGLIQQLGAIRSDPEGRPRRLMRRILDSVKDHDPAAHRGLECMWVVRRFDIPLLRQLLADVGHGDAGTSGLAERLTGYSFVEQRMPPNRPGDRYYVVHEVARKGGLEKIEQSRPLELHRSAEAYYQDLTTDYLDDYEGWFRYENPQWQIMIREWLYHVACLRVPENESSAQESGRKNNRREDVRRRAEERREAQENSRLGLAKLFMDAFWWWGSYVPFDFCEQLLADWTEMARSRKDQVDLDWGETLRGVYTRYPKGWRMQASAADWRDVRQRLLHLWSQKALNGRNLTNSRIRHIRGILDIYLADANRFLNPHDPRVVELLNDAREQFAANNDEWNVAWISFEQADAALGRGDGDAAIAAVDEMADAPEEMGDSELVADFHRVHADAAWMSGDHGLALDCYARAALHAYRFQVVTGDPDIPPCDEYTQTFLAEMHERTAERLAELHAAGEHETAHTACTRIRRFFGPYWNVTEVGDPPDLPAMLDAGRTDEVVRHLFPPPPAASDLHQPGTDYALTAGEVLYEMEHELAKLPGTSLP